jgi:hypothetical protein
MRALKALIKTASLAFAIAAVHYVVTFASLAGAAMSAISTTPTRFPPEVLVRILDVCSFPMALFLAWLPGDLIAWLPVNSALWGIALSAGARWLWTRNKRRTSAEVARLAPGE